MAGDAIYEVIERIAIEGDAAIVLATPDDLGRLAGGAEAPRARQNVWIELGIFWARLGRRRTLLLIKGEVEIPSDYHGLIYVNYKNKISEVSDKLNEFIKSLRTLPPDNLTELIYLSSDPTIRDKQWHEIHIAATKKLIITGISMGASRHSLPAIFTSMKENPVLNLDLVVVDPDFIYEHRALFTMQHRANAVRDNHSYFKDLYTYLQQFAEISDRVQLFLYRGMPPFAAVVADGPDWGSLMLAQPFVSNPSKHPFGYPRFKLKRRTHEGVYMTFWSAIREMISRSSQPIKGIDGIKAVADSISDFPNASMR